MNSENLLFIVGPTRSGSKIYQNALNNLEGVEIFNTLHFLRPKWIGSDFLRITKKFGNLDNEKNLLKLLEAIYSKKLITSPSGTFWSSNALDSINQDRLIRRIKTSSRHPKIILEILLTQIIKSRNIRLLGFRAPVHIRYVNLLRKWYPSSKIIFIVRDPRAILISTIKKNEKYKLRDSGNPAKFFMYIKRFFYVIASFRMSMHQNILFIGDNNFKLIRFEDLLDDDVGVFQEICKFINLEFGDNILDIPNTDSSYNDLDVVSQARGVNIELRNKWREHIHPLVDQLLKFLLRKEMKFFGYLS